MKIIILNKSLSIIKEENKILLKINNTLSNKNIFINIPLKSEINSFIPYINSLNTKINNLENEVKELKNEVKELRNEIKNLKIQQINENKIIEYIRKEEMFKNSKIVEKNEIDMILSWFNIKPSSFNLLLDANIDNNFYKNFYDNCENKYPTIIFIKTTDNIRFGGFTNEIWPLDGEVGDETSFLFSLTKKKKYAIINPEKALGVSNNSFISFGCGNDLYLYSNLKSQGGGTFQTNYDMPEEFELNCGKNTFEVSNCEVYQIEY